MFLGHVITILAPLRIENLLPIEMTCALKNVGSSWQPRISVKPGKIVSILEVSKKRFHFSKWSRLSSVSNIRWKQVDLCKDLGFNVALESFSKCQDFVIPVGTYDNKILLVVCDNQDRPLTLNVTIKAGLGGALKVLSDICVFIFMNYITFFLNCFTFYYMYLFIWFIISISLTWYFIVWYLF